MRDSEWLSHMTIDLVWSRLYTYHLLLWRDVELGPFARFVRSKQITKLCGSPPERPFRVLGPPNSNSSDHHSDTSQLALDLIGSPSSRCQVVPLDRPGTQPSTTTRTCYPRTRTTTSTLILSHSLPLMITTGHLTVVAQFPNLNSPCPRPEDVIPSNKNLQQRGPPVGSKAQDEVREVAVSTIINNLLNLPEHQRLGDDRREIVAIPMSRRPPSRIRSIPVIRSSLRPR